MSYFVGTVRLNLFKCNLSSFFENMELGLQIQIFHSHWADSSTHNLKFIPTKPFASTSSPTFPTTLKPKMCSLSFRRSLQVLGLHQVHSQHQVSNVQSGSGVKYILVRSSCCRRPWGVIRLYLGWYFGASLLSLVFNNGSKPLYIGLVNKSSSIVLVWYCLHRSRGISP